MEIRLPEVARRIGTAALTWVAVVAVGMVAPARAETLVFAPLPMETPEAVIVAWKPLVEYLEKQLAVSIRIEYTDSYADLIEKFVAEKIDLVYLGPLPYVELKKRHPAATPVVLFKEKDGAATYTCAIFAPTEAGLKLNGLRGKKIALTQPLSTCGHLAVDGLLRKAGGNLEKNHYRYLDKHDAVLQAVAAGEFDAGGAKTTIGRKYAHLGIATLAETPPFPGFALIAEGRRLPAARIASIRNALLAAPEALRARFGEQIRHGVVAASDADYAALRAHLPTRPIPQTGNF